MSKFMLSLRDDVLMKVEREARKRDISIQEFIRAVAIPEWFKANEREEAVECRHARR